MRQAGFTLADAASEPPGAPWVVVTAGARRAPTPPRGSSWIWLSSEALGDDAALEAARRGAYDALSIREPEASARLLERLRELTEPEPPPPDMAGVIGDSAAARRLLQQVWRAARSTMPVLLTGETGTGKEVMAGLIHRWSGRAGPYLPINCAAIPDELMESELFGHMRGAFSGAIATVDGKLLAAKGGTVFLDEIEDTPLSTQAKLLRVLEDGEVTRVGETASRTADFRLIAASNRDLLKLVGEARFGRDFYERLAIVRIELPSLTERRDDIPAFVHHFIGRFYQRQGGRPEGAVRDVSARALAALARLPWPGNIRELRNVVYQALVQKRSGSELLLSDLRPVLQAQASRAVADAESVTSAHAVRARIEAGHFNLREAVTALEREALSVALERAGGRPGQAATLLGEVGRGRSTDPGGTVRAMMKRLGMARG